MSPIEQWVNLPSDDSKKSAFKEGKIKKTKRIGPKLKIKVVFDKEQMAVFNWRVTQTGGPTYKPAEVLNSPSRFKGKWKALATNDGKTDQMIEVTLPVSGGALYKVEVKHKGDLIGTKEITTRRRIYYRPFKMKGCETKDGDLSTVYSTMEKVLWSDAKDYYIEAIQDGSDTIGDMRTIDRSKVSGSASTQRLVEMAKTKAKKFAKHEPVAVPILICRSYAQPTTKIFTIRKELPRGVRSNRMIHEFIDIPLVDNKGKKWYLWKDLVPSEDKANDGLGSWFFDGMIIVSETSNYHYTSMLEPKQAIAWGPLRGEWGGYSKVRLAADPDFLDRHAGKTAEIMIKVKVVKGFYNGFSMGGTNVITLMTEVRWGKRKPDDLGKTLVHEMGHKLGMVADGKVGSPAKADHYYGRRKYGHTGRHCMKGCGRSNGKWTGTPKCVMFGASHRRRPGEFCSVCEKIVPKLDVSGDRFGSLLREK